MAVIKPTTKDVSQKGDGSCYLVTWTAVTSASSDTCAAVSFPQYPDRSIQVSGTFGGASVAVQGSNDGTNFCSLFDPSSTVIAIVAATAMKAVLENAVFIRPLVTGGTGQTVTVSMLFRMGNPLRT